MKIVDYVEDGWSRRSILRDQDPDSLAPQGVPLGPPDLSRLNCQAILQEVHDLLMKRDLYSWQDVMAAQNAVTNAISIIVRRHVIALYRMEDKNE